MQKEIICAECANRCKLLVEQQGEDIIITGNRCPRGLKSGREEFLGERVTVHGVVRCSAAETGKVAVHTSKPVQKGMVYKVTLAMKRVKLDKEVIAGDVVVKNISNTDADLIVSE